MVTNLEIKQRRLRMARKKAILEKIKYTAIACVFMAAFIVAAKTGLLQDGPTKYEIPENAISGGIIEVRGKTYEKFQLNGKYYLLDLSNGAEIPQ